MDSDLPSKVELGCGEKTPNGFHGVDIINTDATDQVIDLDDTPWDLPSNHFEVIRAMDVFEHLSEPIEFFEEIFRIGSDGCLVLIRSPHRSSQNWTDPTHERLVGFNTIRQYFSPEGKYTYYTDATFQIQNVDIIFSKKLYYPWNYIISPLVNHSQATKAYFENTFLSRMFPAQDVEFQIRVLKG